MYPYQSTNQTDHIARLRGRIMLAIFAVALTVIIGRFVQLQVMQHQYWVGRAQASQERIIKLPPQRGTILDRNGTVLAVDVRAVAIAVDGININRPDAAIAILHDELDLSRAELQSKVYRESYFTWIDRRVDFDVAQRIRQRAREDRIHGIVFIDTWKRRYPQGRLASNLIGFVGIDGFGLEGIELLYDQHLQGTSRVLHVMKGADSRTYDIEILDYGQPGEDLMLTIDAKLQFICEEEIRIGVNRFDALGGMIVLLDPHTGQVLAMAQDKGYDLNEFWKSTPEQRRNTAVTQLFEPGSVFKVFTGLAALENNVVSLSDMFDGNDVINVSGHVMHNAENRSFGTVTLADIIKHSINTGMIRVARLVGEQPFYDFLSSVGFGRTTGIGLPGEEPGILRPVEDWSGLALAATSIGQSVAVTGIQLARAMAVVASEGILHTPSIVLTDQPEPASEVRVISPATAHTMLELMQAVIEEGTGRWSAIDNFTITGKTGTAQKAIPGRGYVEGKYMSLFVGIISAESPDYVMLVVLDEVQSRTVAGGYTAGQIFQRAATQLIAYKQLTPP